jgi:hypothetical protein
LDSLYSRWHDKTKPLFIDAPSELIKDILAKYTVVNKEFLGLVEPEEKKIYTELIDKETFDGKGLKIYKRSTMIIFEYNGLTQTWKKEEDNLYEFMWKTDKGYRLKVERFDIEYLTQLFATSLLPDFIGKKKIVDRD